MLLVYTAFSIAEQIALAPLLIGESITSTSLVAAESSIDVLSAIFPGSDEASFSLASFVALVKREWNQPALDEHLPRDRYSVAEVAKALVAWGALQGVTHEWKENEWFSVLKEINVDEVEDVDGVGGDGGADRCTWLGLLGLWANPPRPRRSSGGIRAILTPLGGPRDGEDRR